MSQPGEFQTPDTLCNLDEISRFLGVSPKTVYYWVSRHEIPYVKVGRHLRFQPSEVLGFFQTQTPQTKLLAKISK